MDMYRYKKINLKGSYRDKHRLIMEKHLGRKLTFNEVVDHINGNPKDDRLENLRLMTRSEHAKMHYQKGDFKFHSNEAKAKRRVYDSARRLPHTKNKFTCAHCKKMKHKSKFQKNKARWNGINSWCSECYSKRKVS